MPSRPKFQELSVMVSGHNRASENVPLLPKVQSTIVPMEFSEKQDRTIAMAKTCLNYTAVLVALPLFSCTVFAAFDIAAHIIYMIIGGLAMVELSLFGYDMTMGLAGDSALEHDCTPGLALGYTGAPFIQSLLLTLAIFVTGFAARDEESAVYQFGKIAAWLSPFISFAFGPLLGRTARLHCDSGSVCDTMINQFFVFGDLSSGCETLPDNKSILEYGALTMVSATASIAAIILVCCGLCQLTSLVKGSVSAGPSMR